MTSKDEGAARTVPLSRPLEADGEKRTALVMRDPGVRDYLTASEQAGPAATSELREVCLIAVITNVGREHVESLRLADLQALQRALADLLAGGAAPRPKTSAAPSSS